MVIPDTCRAPQEDFHGHPIDPKTKILIAHVQATQPDIILIIQEPPSDVPQEELPY